MSDVYSVGDRVEGQGFNLTQKISGIKKLSPKILKVLAGGGLVLLILLMYAIDSSDAPTPVVKPSNAGDPNTNEASGSATLPLDLTEDVNDGVPAFNTQGPTPINGANAAPLVPATGTLSSSVMETEAAPSPKVDTIAEKRRRDRERAMESNGPVSGFNEVTASLSNSENPGASKAEVEALLAAQAAQAKTPVDEQDDQNKQVRKEKFLKRAEAENEEGYLAAMRKPQITPYEIKAGSVIPAVLKSAINSDLPGLIRGIVTDHVYDSKTGRYILIPRGSTLIGTYDSQIAYGQKRLLAVWTKIIFPDGSTMALKGMPGADQEGSAGMSGEVDNHYLKIFGAALASSVISAGYQISQGGQNVVGLGTTVQTPGQTMASSLGQQLGQAGTAITTKNLNLQPTLTNPVGQRFFINITKDLVFQQPYE
ncbi:TrbI/VirB10 family protein [Methylovorus glucosotrophus]|uniref:Conjugation TrbI family protein n=1 Tax=Methylovorus glucosotrophus (strain SIP3-4) TaxID=582744 RepID=C6XER7_METGS|nr:TrbI/VirB10 family protein [Methylovorus glucosotrophus]ACT52124.1 conjugation TrbI family protein [Methylovorus glucosotrophus SIP3-4]